jgi:hypothetical protein
MRAVVLWISIVAGCFHARQPTPANQAIATNAIDEREPAPPHAALVATDDAAKTMFVAGCNRGCVGCGLGAYKTYVIGIQHGQRVFPPAQPGPGYSCATQAAVGERVTLLAHSPEEGLVIVDWETPLEGDYCPCKGTSASVCHVDITADVVAHYNRVYCGAHWSPKYAAIAR